MNSIKQLLDFLRFILISPETLILLVIIVCSHYFPSYFVIIGSSVKKYSDVWRWMPGIPGFCAAVSYKLYWKILTPLDNSNTKALYEWPEYWKLKHRVVATLIICVMITIASIIIWFFSDNFSDYSLGIIFASLVAVPVVSLLCELLAAIRVRELLDRYS